jgi:anti-sigma B factor antagonist
MDLRTSNRIVGGVAVVEVGGEIELNNAAQLRAMLVDSDQSDQVGLVIDLSGVTFIDSTGIGVLVGALKRAREHGQSFVLASPQRRVRRIFEITGLLGVFSLCETVEEAIARAAEANPLASGLSDNGAREE